MKQRLSPGSTNNWPNSRRSSTKGTEIPFATWKPLSFNCRPIRRFGQDRRQVDRGLDQSNEIGRGIICRQLRVVGTDKCVPVIAPLLTDPKLADFARYALQGIGSNAAAKAMHEALGKTSGALQVGLINSLAACHYEPLRGDCIRLIQSQNSEVAAAAIRALGKLGGVGVGRGVERRKKQD